MSKDARPTLIPQPREITYRGGHFALGGRVSVDLGGGKCLEDEHATRVLLSELHQVLGRGHTGARLHVEARRRSYWLLVGPKDEPAKEPKQMRRLGKEGYELRVGPRSIEVPAGDLAGLCHGLATLRQLASGRKRVPCVTIRDWPALALRGVHYDLKGLMPTFDALMGSLAELSRLKLNCILLEYEDKFPWSKDLGLASPLAFSTGQLRRFLEEARARHIRVIPLIQALGHAEMVLQHRKYARLREVADDFYQYCPNNPRSVELIKRLIDEVAEFHQGEPLFHVGADEAWLLGTCTRCARAAKKAGKNGLYLKHMGPLWEHVFSLGKRPVMWDDMLRHFSLKELRQVPRDVVLMYWLYNRFEPDVAKHFPDLPRYLEQGFDVLGASAAKGADGSFANLPNFDRRLRNISAWAQVARRYRLGGVVSTAWSRYTYMLAPCEPFDSMWLSLAGSAQAYWSGKPTSPEALARAFVHFEEGVKDDDLAESLLHPEGPGHARLAELLRARADSGRCRSGHWALLSVLHELEAWIERRRAVEKQVVHQLPLLEAGRLPRSSRRRLKQRVRDTLSSARSLRGRLKQELRRTLPPAEVEEFLASRLDGYEAVLRGLGDAVR